MVLYWCIEQPRKIGFLAAWLLGLIMDVADGTLFGQHALAYTILAYAGIVLHRRVRMFAVTSQVLHVVPLLLMNDLIVLAIRAARRRRVSRASTYFIGSFVGGALWPVLVALFRSSRSARSPIPTMPELSINPGIEIRNAQLELHHFRVRLAHRVRASCWSCSALLAGRFFYLQVVQHEQLHTLAEANRISIVPVVPNRGIIVDRNGVVLAHNYSAYTLEITAGQGRRPGAR